MPLSVGTRLGVYEVIALIGEGGMGQVYRARDTKLNRDVALKILPDAFASDPDRLARFTREAQTLAALNHANIAHIHGLEETGGVRALVMELVEGEDLAQLIARGAIPVTEALPIAKQIAEALEAAHEQGIVHRDLKPANIKVRPDGAIKILDFGLAKALDPLASSSAAAALANSPTLTTPPLRTGVGVILGTAAYMSPEQARGQAVDKRADIWAFGCVLYQMLTGHSPFARDTMTDTLAAILDREPSWSALPATPAPVQRLLRRCLDKDPRRRLHDIADARIEIDDVLSGAAPMPGEAAGDPPPHPGRLPWWTAAIASVVTLVALGVTTWNIRTARRAETAPPRVSRLVIGSSGAAALALTGARSLTITPDGTRVVYVGNNDTQIFVRPLDRLDATAILTGVAPLNFVFVSPDGQWVGFEEGNTLKKVAITGGPSSTIARIGVTRGATWAPDDTIIIATADPATGLQRVPADGGELTVLTQPTPARGERAYVWPEMLPGGRAVLFTIIAATGGLDAAQIAVFDLKTRTATVLVRGGSHAHYVASGRGSPARVERADGHLLYVAGGRLDAVPFDLARLQTRGTATAVLPRLVTTPSGAGEYAVSADGTLAYADAPDVASAAMSTLVWVDRQGREEPLGAPPHAYFQPRVSPDGTRVAVAIAEHGNDIWVWDLARQRLSQLTTDPASEFSPVWTHDGRHLLFFSPDVEAGFFWQRTDGIGEAERLGDGLPTGVTPGDAQVLFSTSGARDIKMMTLDGTRRVTPLVQTPSDERNGVVSPDGRWLAYESNSTGKFEIYVRPFPNVSTGQRLISTAGGTRPLWAGGRELIFVAPDGALMSVRVDPRGETWSHENPVRVPGGPYSTLSSQSGRSYDVSTDGKRFLVVKQRPNPTAPPQLIVVQNWFEELKTRVPLR